MRATTAPCMAEGIRLASSHGSPYPFLQSVLLHQRAARHGRGQEVGEVDYFQGGLHMQTGKTHFSTLGAPFGSCGKGRGWCGTPLLPLLLIEGSR
jgi:hypothetical protein